MDAEDLMFNDWVIVNGQPTQLWLEDIFNLQIGKFEAEPIQITKDILKANGIPTNADPFMFDEDDECNLELIYEDGNLYWSINLAEYHVLKFNYVHELQNAMRLCGLQNLAENFKLE